MEYILFLLVWNQLSQHCNSLIHSALHIPDFFCERIDIRDVLLLSHGDILLLVLKLDQLGLVVPYHVTEVSLLKFDLNQIEQNVPLK